MTDMDRQHLRVRVLQAEGMRLFPYIDSQGKITIGAGHNLTDNGITQAEAEQFLTHDLARAEADAMRVVGCYDELDGIRQSVIVEMVFNLGAPRLLTFRRLLAALEAREYRAAATEMRSSRWATQVGQRAETLARMMETGDAKTASA